MTNANIDTRILITENFEVHTNKANLSWIAYSYIYPIGYAGSCSYLQECLKQRFSYRESAKRHQMPSFEPGQNKPGEILKGPGIAIERPSVMGKAYLRA